LKTLKKFKRAAYIDDQDGKWQFQGFYKIERNEIEYDVSSTMHRIKWEDESIKDTLKHESDFAGDIEIGDVVLFDQGTEDIEFGRVTKKKAIGYGVKKVIFDELNKEWLCDLNENTLFLASEKINLWEKRKPSDEETNVEHSAENFSEVFFEQIADMLNAKDKSNLTAHYIREIIANHVSEEENVYLDVHPREFLTSDEINEVIKWARQSSEKKHCKKPTNEIVKIEILNYWGSQMKKEKRRADNLSVFAAQKLFEKDRIKIKVLGPRAYESRSQFLISLREIPTKAEIPYRREKNDGTDETENDVKRKRYY